MFPVLIKCGWVFYSEVIHGKMFPNVKPGFLKTQFIPKLLTESRYSLVKKVKCKCSKQNYRHNRENVTILTVQPKMLHHPQTS